jgi:hypothetical protein
MIKYLTQNELNNNESFEVYPKKFCPHFYFDSRDNNYPINFSLLLSDIEAINNNLETNLTIVPNFINYYTRIVRTNYSTFDRKNDLLVVYRVVWYYYFLIYVDEHKIKNRIKPIQLEISDIQIKLIVLEVINDQINRIFFNHNYYPNSNEKYMYWMNKEDTQKLLLSEGPCGFNKQQSSLLNCKEKSIPTINLYNSYKSHNSYPYKGRFWRFFGLFNDKTDGKKLKKCSVSKLRDEILISKYFEPFRNLLTEDLNKYPEISIDQIKYYNLFRF